jgi:hypothetical protein
MCGGEARCDASAQGKAEIKPARKGALIHCIPPKQEVRDHSLLRRQFRSKLRSVARKGASVATIEPNLHRVTTIESRAKPTFVDAIPQINVSPRRLEDDDE